MRIPMFMLMLLMVLSTQFLAAKKIAVFEELMKPLSMAMDDQNFYIAEGTTIYIYDRKSYSLVKKFGKRGEGPQEFNMSITRMEPQGEFLQVNSLGKLSLLKKDGTLVSEVKIGNPAMGNIFLKLGNGYVGTGVEMGKAGPAATVSIFDKDAKKIKELARYQMMLEGKINVLNMGRVGLFFIHQNKIYLTADKGFEILVFNEKGDLLKSIKEKVPRVKLTDAEEKGIRAIMKQRMPAGQYEVMKDRFIFPEYYPDLFNVQVEQDRIYGFTMERKENRYMTYIFDMKGKLLKKTYIDFKMKQGIEPFPSAIRNNNLYQIIENEDTETWELHVFEIK